MSTRSAPGPERARAIVDDVRRAITESLARQLDQGLEVPAIEDDPGFAA